MLLVLPQDLNQLLLEENKGKLSCKLCKGELSEDVIVLNLSFVPLTRSPGKWTIKRQRKRQVILLLLRNSTCLHVWKETDCILLK